MKSASGDSSTQRTRRVSLPGRRGASSATRRPRSWGSAPAAAERGSLLGLPRLDVGREPGAELSVGEVIGTGGMGVVCSAVQHALGREVAIKHLRPDRAAPPAAISSMLAEARIQGALEHPNIVPIHAIGRDAAGMPVLVMKRLSGVSWRELIRDPDHPAWPRDATDRLAFHLDVLMQVCNAVHFAHSRGVIHRDIKPDNVMVGAFGEVYLLDWGVAHRLTHDAVDTAIVGSPAYIAPEMLHGSGPHIGPSTDVYLLGASLHQALTGQARHQGSTVEEVLLAAADSAPFDYPPSVPAELAALCNQATSREPSARPASALAFRQALAEFLRHRGSIALADAASSRFAELYLLGSVVPAGDDIEPGRDARIRRLYVEARFGFKQALSAWEGNQAAGAQLDALVAWMIEYELSRRNIEAAAALLADFRAPPPALVARIDALREEDAREREELLRLRNAARDHDPLVLYRVRLAMTIAAGLCTACAFLVSWSLHPSGASHVDIIVSGGTITLFLLALLAAGGRNRLKTNYNWQIAIGVTMLIACPTLNHVFGALFDLPVSPVFIGDMIGNVGVSVMHASVQHPTIRRAHWISPGLFLLGALVIGFRPDLAVLVMASISLLIPLFTGPVVWRHMRRLDRALSGHPE